MRKRPLPLAFKVQKFLAGLRYPTQKAAAIAHAAKRGADEELLAALNGLPDDVFDTPIRLSTALKNR